MGSAIFVPSLNRAMISIPCEYSIQLNRLVTSRLPPSATSFCSDERGALLKNDLRKPEFCGHPDVGKANAEPYFL
jgi:hypothetical protein